MFVDNWQLKAALQQKAAPTIYILRETALMAPERLIISLVEGKWCRILLLNFQISIKTVGNVIPLLI